MDKKLEATLKRRASGELRLDVKGLQRQLLETSENEEPVVPPPESGYIASPTVKHPSINPPPRASTVYIDPEAHLGWDDWEEETAC